MPQNPKAAVILANQINNEANRLQISEESLQFVIDFFAMLNKLDKQSINHIARQIEIKAPGEFGELVQRGHQIAKRCNIVTINPTKN